ncbi:MAG TPA: CoA-binding protein [Baekduia sp.]|uniref:CoA-binding protein n=1 Tax=Baekduia sp. TaxID=2600305 RepID=UPI002D77195D|nr:CoA-binding protein [Baekduia sp.]HET6507457.1 CoA-binding protein [Baekduia sp.]
MDDDVRAMLTSTKAWAVVGCSPDPSRDSHRIAALLRREGFTVIPVNPRETSILGERCYPSVTDIPDDVDVDVVDVFRRADQAGVHVDEAIARPGVKGVWLQLGVIDEAAAERARKAGLHVAMDRCPAIELPRLRAATS